MKIKIIKVITIFFVVLLLTNSVVFAGKTIDTNQGKIDPLLTNQFDDVGSSFASLIRIIGMIVSVGALMIIGIKYMLSSAEEKAMHKESMIYYVIGALLTFGIVNIIASAYSWIKTL
ncbi:MAG: hypothetical protein HFJ17_01025 [Clostridia bacterium]|nr:hypothetical protein [Clostridia bacterium]